MEEPRDQKNFELKFSHQKYFNSTTSTKVRTKKPPTTTMPVLVNKYNEMLENFNTIRDILNKPTIDLNELRQLLTRVSQDKERRRGRVG